MALRERCEHCDKYIHCVLCDPETAQEQSAPVGGGGRATARFYGVCAALGDDITPGDDLVNIGDEDEPRWAHDDCAEEVA